MNFKEKVSGEIEIENLIESMVILGVELVRGQILPD